MVIPLDIITEILYRLPSESIGRFRCVSKEWLSLLTQPEFIKTHRITLNRNHHIFNNYDASTSCCVLYSHPFHHHDPFILNPTKLPLELTNDNQEFRGSCDGLVLVSSVCDDDNMGGRFDKLVLLNPTTREYVQLPQSVGYYPKRKEEESVHIYSTHGVGYDSVTDDYKVITLTYFDYYVRGHYIGQDRVTRLTLRLSIYSLRSNTWRQRIIDSPNYDCRRYASAVYVNGFLHWFGWKKDTDPEDTGYLIVAFSLVDECFREVPSPDLCNDTKIMSRCCEFVVLGGKLAIYAASESDFEVWLMNEYGVKESWTKIPLDIINDNFRDVKSMIFDDNGNIRVAGKGQIFIYDYKKTTFSKTIYAWSGKFWLFGSYVESLVSPKRKDMAGAKPILETQNVSSEASEVALLENADPNCHLFLQEIVTLC